MKQTKDTAQFHSWTEMAKTQDSEQSKPCQSKSMLCQKKKKKKFNKWHPQESKDGFTVENP